MIKDIEEFVSWYNTDQLTSTAVFNSVKYEHALNHSIEQLSKQRTRIGLSELYKYPLFLGLKKVGFPAIQSNVKVKTLLIFFMGFLFEEFISNLMEVKGLEVEAGVEVELAGFTGHIDRVVNGTVMEIKTMNSKYFEEFTKSPNNARGYYTQLALYAVLYRAEDNCCWLCLNKDTGEIRLVIPERQTLISYWDSACENLETLLQFNSLEDVANYKLPAPRPEIFKGKVTGKLLIPQEFYGFTHVDCFYELRYGQNGYKQDRFYVANQLKPDHILECLINRAEDIINDSIIGQESRVPDGDNSLCSGEG